MSDILLREDLDRITILTMNDPSSRNALGAEMINAIVTACDSVNRNSAISCVILMGAGPAFCAGGNVKEMRDRVGMFGGSPSDMRKAYADTIQQIPRAMHALEIPAIAAVQGPAVGAGCDIAMMCDLRIAAANASFAESFLRVGLISGDGGAWFLPRIVGVSRARQMAFTADAVDAKTALEWGMVSSVVAPDDLRAAALALAGRIARHPPQAIRLMKRLFRDGPEACLEHTLELSSLMQATAQHSPDFAEAVSAFLEKREPIFSGR